MGMFFTNTTHSHGLELWLWWSWNIAVRLKHLVLFVASSILQIVHIIVVSLTSKRERHRCCKITAWSGDYWLCTVSKFEIWCTCFKKKHPDTFLTFLQGMLRRHITLTDLQHQAGDSFWCHLWTLSAHSAQRLEGKKSMRFGKTLQCTLSFRISERDFISNCRLWRDAVRFLCALACESPCSKRNSVFFVQRTCFTEIPLSDQSRHWAGVALDVQKFRSRQRNTTSNVPRQSFDEL